MSQRKSLPFNMFFLNPHFSEKFTSLFILSLTVPLYLVFLFPFFYEKKCSYIFCSVFYSVAWITNIKIKSHSADMEVSSLFQILENNKLIHRHVTYFLIKFVYFSKFIFFNIKFWEDQNSKDTMLYSLFTYTPAKAECFTPILKKNYCLWISFIFLHAKISLDSEKNKWRSFRKHR